MKADTLRTDERDAGSATAEDVRAAHRLLGLPVPLVCEDAYPAVGRVTRGRSRDEAADLVACFAHNFRVLAGTKEGGDLLYAFAVLAHYDLQPRWHPLDRWQAEGAAAQSRRTLGARARALRGEESW